MFGRPYSVLALAVSGGNLLSSVPVYLIGAVVVHIVFMSVS